MKTATLILTGFLLVNLSQAQFTITNDSLYQKALILLEEDYDQSYQVLLEVLESEENNSEKLFVYRKYIREVLYSSSTLKVPELADEALAYGCTKDNLTVYATVLKMKISVLMNQKEKEKSKSAIDHLQEIARQYADLSLLSDSHSYKAQLYYFDGDLVAALDQHLEAVRYAEQSGDPSKLAYAWSEIAIVYQALDQLTIAASFNRKALKVYDSINRVPYIAKVSTNLGSIYLDQEKFDSAEYFFTQAFHIIDTVFKNPFGANTIQINLGLIAYNRKDYSTAVNMWVESLDFFSKQSDEYSLCNLNYYLARYYKEVGEPEKAFSYAETGFELASESGLLESSRDFAEILAQLHEEKNSYGKALYYQKEYTIAKDSLFNESKSREIGRLESKNEIENQKIRLQLQESEIDKQDTKEKTLYGGLALLGIISLLIFRSQRIKSKSNQQLKETEALKNRWIVNISHELKTPLTLIQGPMNKILQNGKLNPVDKQDLIIASKSTKHLNKLVMEMLDLSKADKGLLELKRAAVDFGDIVRTTAAAFDSMAINNGVTLTIQAHSTVWMDLDGARIRKVIENLITNAFKFTQENGEIQVEIKEEDEQIVLSVSDSGEGISEEDLPHIFERYFQSKNPAKSRAGGTGVGLSLSNEIVELHGGTIKVNSREGEGSTFEVQLPKGLLVDEPEVLIEREESSIVEEVQDQPLYTQMSKGVPRILLVEDNYEMRQFIQSILKDNFSITLAKDGQEAMQKLVGTTYDLIISDIMMPRMDGKQLIEKVKASDDTKDIPFVVLTALNDDEDKLDVLRTGVDDYLSKPFDAEELKLRIANLVANRNSRAEESDPEEGDDLLMVGIEKDIRSHLNDPQYSVSMMAENANMSVRNLHRIIKQKTGLTPLGLINELKLQHAMRLLEKGEVHTLKEICAAIGFDRTDRFSATFKKRFGRRPADYL